MNNRFMISVAALALIAGTGLANAQGTGGREQGGAAMQHNAPTSQGGGATENRESPSSGMKSGQSQSGQSYGTKGQRAEENAPGQKSKGMSSENETKGMKTQGEGRGDRETNRNAQSREGRENNQNMKAEGREDRGGNMNAETKPGTRSQTTTGQAGAGAGAKLSSDQRTRITSVLRNERVAPADHVSFSVAVGSRVPREGITLHPLPAEVATIYPEWRGYEFIRIRDQIVVIDPATDEIVAILEA